MQKYRRRSIKYCLFTANCIVISYDFTCTFNRADTLTRTYKSLVNQTVRNFEWVVYDNGSTDNTAELIERWKEEADFPIVYLSRPDNSGFQRSYNHGIKAARGYFWLLLDSDDEVVPEAFSKMVELWREIPDDKKHEFTGVAVNCMDQHGKLVGHPFPFNRTDSNSLEIFYKHKVRSEKFGMHRVEVLRNYPFPDVENHVNPSIVWWSIAKNYQIRFANETLRIYYIEEEDRPDQLSFHTTLSTNGYGRRMNHLLCLNDHLKWLFYDPIQFVKHAMVYNICSIATSVGLVKTITDVKPVFGKLLVFLTLPAAAGYLLFDQLRFMLRGEHKIASDG